MRSLILCEGFDDVLILGYFLHKTLGWVFDPKAVFSKQYSFPKLDYKRQVVEVYVKNEDFIGIWAVGGKDSFKSAYEFIYRINEKKPEEGINKVFILKDRDEDEIESCLVSLKDKLNEIGFKVSELHNSQENKYYYEVEEEQYCLDIIPIIVPFDRNGALETVLMEGIAESGNEEAYIVECADRYVDEVIASGRLQKYLQHERLVLKARLSSVISITNPDRSTALFDKVLMSWDWEAKEAVQRHFNMILHYLE